MPVDHIIQAGAAIKLVVLLEPVETGGRCRQPLRQPPSMFSYILQFIMHLAVSLITPRLLIASRQRAALLLAACALYLPSSHAQTAAPHLLVGTWNWTVFSGQCAETLQYSADGVLIATSGQAVTAWRYVASATPDAQGFYKVVETYLRTNGKKDCQGDTLEDDDFEATLFVQLSPAKDRLIVCKTATLAACYGPLKREQR